MNYYKTFLGLLIAFSFTIIAMEADVDAPLNAAGETPLMRAITKYDINKVQQLIDAGADVNFRTKYGMSPHTLATMGAMFNPKGEAILQLLESHGAKGHHPFKITVGSETRESGN